MELERQVVSLELAKELKKNGYPQKEGLWWWVHWNYSGNDVIYRDNEMEKEVRNSVSISQEFIAPTQYWVNIPRTRGLYQISNFGQVRREGKIIKANISPNGYYYLDISVDNKRRTIRPHQIMAEVFLPNPHDYPQVNHKNSNKLANWIDNLEWCTAKQNMAHSYKQGTHKRDKQGKYLKRRSYYEESNKSSGGN